MTIMAVLVVFCNGTFNYILMFGKLGFPAMGARGCGLATTISMVVFFLMLICYTGFSDRFRSTRLLSTIHWPLLSEAKRILKIGIPIGCTFTNEYLVLAVITFFIGSQSTLGVSAHQVAFSCVMLFFTIPAAMSFAASIRVGNLIGNGDPRALKSSQELCRLYSAVLRYYRCWHHCPDVFSGCPACFLHC